MKKNHVYIVFILFALIACKKKKEEHVNPFEEASLQPPPPSGNTYNPDPNSFEYLYHNMFKPTCANSGCHDGSFEPDFRTLTGAYDNLVYAPPVLNPNNAYQYRVLPNNTSASILALRLTQMPGSGPGTIGQGRMPWNDTMYKFSTSGSDLINKVMNWINNGARDIFGNPAVPGNKHPLTQGFQVTNAGSSTKHMRGAYLEISKNNGPLDFWVSVTDDATPIQNLTPTMIKLSKYKYDFSQAVTLPLTYTATGHSWNDMTNTQNVDYNYVHANYDLDNIQNDTGYVFVRTYFKDADHTSEAELPNNGTMYYTNHFVIRIMP